MPLVPRLRALPVAAALAFAPIVLVPSVAVAQTAAPMQMSLERFKLDNGLEVILEENHRAPNVAVAITYHVGWKDDPVGRKGFAHLVDRMLATPSTRHVSRKVVDDVFRALKVDPVSRAVESTADRTTIALMVPSEELDLALWFESDRMGFQGDGMDQPTMDSLRDGIDSRRRWEEENRSYGAVPRAIREALFPVGHPYRTARQGVPAELLSITNTELKAFAKTFLVPNNASLVLVGHFETAKTKELITKYFGPIVKGTSAVPKVEAAPVTLEKDRVLRVEANVSRPMLFVTWPSPALFATGDVALDATYQILTGTAGSRLRKRLVEGKVADAVISRQRSLGLGSQFDIEITLSPGHTPGEALRLVDEELDRLRSQPPSSAELARAQKTLIRGTAFNAETFAGRAGQHAYYHHHRGDPAFLNTYLSEYGGLSPTAVQDAVKAFLPSKGRVIVEVVVNGKAPAGGRVVEGK